MAKLSYSMVMARYDALEAQDAALRRFYTPEPPPPDDAALPALLDADSSLALERCGANPANSSLTNFGMGFQPSPFDTAGKRRICQNGAMVKHRFADVLEVPVQGDESSSDEEEDDFPSTQRALSRLSMPESGYASTRGSGFGAAAVVARAHTPDSAALEKQIVDKMNRDLERRSEALRRSLEERVGAEGAEAPVQEPALFDQILNPTAKIKPTETQVETVNTGRAAAQKNADALSGRRSQLQRSLTAESARVNSSRASAGSLSGAASDAVSQASGSQSAQPEQVFERSTPAWRLSIKSPGRAATELSSSQNSSTFVSQADSSGLSSTQSRLLTRDNSRDSVASRRTSHSRDGSRDTPTLEEPLRPGAPPRQPKPRTKAGQEQLARKKLLVLCDLPKRGDNRPGYQMLSTERYQGEMKALWEKKQKKQKRERERRRQAALRAAEARGERPEGGTQNQRPSSADPKTYDLRIQLPEHLGFPALSREYAFELRVTDVSAAGKPSHTWPLLTLGPKRFLQFQGDISSDRTVLSPATALPWIQEAVAAAEVSSRPGPKGAQVISRHLSEHGLRIEVWPWKYLPEDGRTGEEAVLVSMKKAIDICVYYTLGREAKVRRLAYKDQVWLTSPPPPGQQFDSAIIPPSDIVQSCCEGATTMISVDAKTDGSSQGGVMPVVKQVGRRAVPSQRLKSILKRGGHSETVENVDQFMQVSQLEAGVGGVSATSASVLEKKEQLSAQEKANARRLIHSPERTCPSIVQEGTELMMARTSKLTGMPASPPREVTRPSFEMTRGMDFNDSTSQMARRMSDFVPVPPIGYELQRSMDMGVEIGGVDLAERQRSGTPERT